MWAKVLPSDFDKDTYWDYKSRKDRRPLKQKEQWESRKQEYCNTGIFRMSKLCSANQSWVWSLLTVLFLKRNNGIWVSGESSGRGHFPADILRKGCSYNLQVLGRNYSTLPPLILLSDRKSCFEPCAINNVSRDWRDGSSVKSTCWSYREPRFSP